MRICHLYPDMMNLYGDRGNVISLVQRCRWRGLDVRVEAVSLGDRPDFASYDIIFMGGGQDREQELICHDFKQVKGQSLAEAVDAGVPLLAICGAYQLMGRYYLTSDNHQVPGLGVLDAWTEAGPRRMIGNSVAESDLFVPKQTLVGFENHAGRTYLGPRARPLGKVLKGYGNNGEDGKEGLVYKNSIGTYLHGSVLPKNPWLADWLIQQALTRKSGKADLRPLDDSLEVRAHQAAVRRALGSLRTRRAL